MSDFVLHPRLEADSLFMRDLTLCQLRLNNVKSVPWLVLVPKRPDVREIFQLSKDDRALLMEETAQASKALAELYAPDKINVAALGNIVSQLHVHVIARFTADVAWPDPVFGRVAAEPYGVDAATALRERLDRTAFWTS
jgi:diadenosine tetraphosphate (Ap4A) HIT family hydrolase